MRRTKPLRTGFRVYKHQELSKVTEEKMREDATQVLEDADQGIQTAVTNEHGTVKSVVGLNGTRYLPDPDPDPLDEILRAALTKASKGPK